MLAQRLSLLLLLLLLSLLFQATPSSAKVDDPRELQLEEALLQQLHPVIVSSLSRIYKEPYSQFDCLRILFINERVTAKIKREEARPVDAIHGGKYFEITVGLCRSNNDYVELDLRNDRSGSLYYLTNYRFSRR